VHQPRERGAAPHARRRRTALLAAALVSTLLAAYGLYRLMNARTFQLFAPLVASVPGPERVLALTVDDGPVPDGVAPLLELLRRHGVRATFFVNGANLRSHPELGRKIVQAGHQLGNHGDTHARLVFRSQSFIRHEVEATDQAIHDAGFTGDILFRPPHGKKLFGLPWFLRQTGRLTVMWNLEPESTPGVPPTPEAQTAFVLHQITPGSILLMHAMIDPSGRARRALELMIPALQSQGYRFVTVSELLASRPN
jgi:peptidoglycan/xylan/chitin deacetylase (PgdA/CDA1 family)